MDETQDSGGSPAENSKAPSGNLDLVLGVEVEVTVRLGSATMTMGEVLELGEGDIVQLREKAEAPVLLCLNEKVVAKGEVVLVEDRLGLKLTELLQP